MQDAITCARKEWIVVDIAPILSTTLPENVIIDRVIGYGSYFWGGYEEGTSDIDICVLLTHPDGCALLAGELLQAKRALPGALYVEDVTKFERLRTLTHTMPGKVLARGIVLYENATATPAREQARASALSYIEARAEWVSTWRERAELMLWRAIAAKERPARNVYRKIRNQEVGSTAQAACVFALWSVLYANDIDASPKSIRWDTAKLLAIAAVFEPQLKPLSARAKRLTSAHIFYLTQYENIAEATRFLALAESIFNVLNLSTSSAGSAT
jgi:hypothetical protein